MSYIAISVAFVVGAVSGFSQSLAFGFIVGSWDGGTGLAWGLIVGVVAAVAALFFGWGGVLVALVLAGVIFAASYFCVRRERANVTRIPPNPES